MPSPRLSQHGHLHRRAGTTGVATPLGKSTVATIKRYLFDSPGIQFHRDNYEAWVRLASGQGLVDDVRWFVHETTETAERSWQGFMPTISHPPAPLPVNSRGARDQLHT